MRILTVCTGNICRSALAASQLRSDLDGSVFEVSSAGVGAVVGGLVPREQLRIGTELGLEDLTDHRGQQLTEQMLADSDLVLVATLSHRATVVRMYPAASAKTFTFREFAHLARAVTGEDLENLTSDGQNLLLAGVQAVAQLRGSLRPPPGEDPYDVIDPYMEDTEAYKRSAEQLVPAVKDIAKYLKIVLEFRN